MPDQPADRAEPNPIAEVLAGSVLQELNGEVDVKGKQREEVAESRLKSKGFIGK